MILKILVYFFEMYAEIIYENHNDFFDDDKLYFNLIAARVMIKEINNIACRNRSIFDRLKELIEVNTNNNDSEIAKVIIQFYGNTTQANLAV